MNQKPKNPNQPKNKGRRGHQPPRAKAVREYTAGGVVFRHAGSGIELLMIQDPKGRWTIPKGHVEPGESLEQTALREVKEETGLQTLKIRDRLDKIHFFYRLNGKLIFMTTHVYLMEAGGNSSQLEPEQSFGVADAKWFAKDEALKLIEYKDIERLFHQGLAKIRRPVGDVR